MSISLQSYRYNVWAMQKEEIKDAYPKKVCHMPTSHVKKKEKEKENIAYTKKIYKGERIHIKEFHPPSTKNIHTLARLDQGLWLVSPLDPVFDLAKYEKQIRHHTLHQKEAIRSMMEKKGIQKKALVRNETHLSDSRDHPRNLQNFFSKTL